MQIHDSILTLPIPLYPHIIHIMYCNLAHAIHTLHPVLQARALLLIILVASTPCFILIQTSVILILLNCGLYHTILYIFFAGSISITPIFFAYFCQFPGNPFSFDVQLINPQPSTNLPSSSTIYICFFMFFSTCSHHQMALSVPLGQRAPPPQSLRSLRLGATFAKCDWRPELELFRDSMKQVRSKIIQDYPRLSKYFRGGNKANYFWIFIAFIECS